MGAPANASVSPLATAYATARAPLYATARMEHCSIQTVMIAMTMKGEDSAIFFDNILLHANLNEKLANEAKGFVFQSLEDGLCVGVSIHNISIIEHFLNLGANPQKNNSISKLIELLNKQNLSHFY
jgi:hypothetical protein